MAMHWINNGTGVRILIKHQNTNRNIGIDKFQKTDAGI